MVNESRVAIIGAGSVGATIAVSLLLRKVCSEILLVDVAQDVLHGQALDLQDAAFVSATQVREGTYEEAGQCDIIVITAGAKQKEGETRQDLIDRNYKILQSVFKSLGKINERAIILLVANPVDILTHIAQQLANLPKKQVFGSGTFLDTGRLRLTLSQILKVSETAIHCYVLGEHGDSQFVAWSSAVVGGKPLLSFPQMANVDKEKIAKDVAGKAYEIIKLKGATYFGIGACVSSLCEAILMNQRHIRPLSIYSDRYDCVLSLPAVIGSKGVEKTIDIPLNDAEMKDLQKSVQSMREICAKYSNQ